MWKLRQYLILLHIVVGIIYGFNIEIINDYSLWIIFSNLWSQNVNKNSLNLHYFH
jgi:hypothetical protein